MAMATIVCPVCEHPQAQGTECEVCGRVLGPASADAPPPPSPLADLERTGVGPADAGGVSPLADLEPTFHAPAAGGASELTGPPDAVPDLEATGAAPVDVDVAPDPEIERTEHLDLPLDDGFALPALPVCRYCRTPATADERICARCGMRLPTGDARPSPAPGGEGEARRCSCGMLLGPGTSRCPGCGARAG
jgi:hypothetical protein